MMSENKIKYLILGFFVFIFGSYYIPNIAIAQHPAIGGAMPGGQYEGFNPYYARFWGADGSSLIVGQGRSLFLYNLEENRVKELISGNEVHALSIDHESHNRALVSLGNNKMYLIEKSGHGVKKILLASLDQFDPNWIKGFLFYSGDTNVFLAYDLHNIFVTRDKGRNWVKLMYPDYTPVSQSGCIIITLNEDPNRAGSFLFYHGNGDRFRGDWQTGRIEYVIEKAVPHGYIQKKNGMEFILIGKNADVFGFNNLKIQILDYFSIRDGQKNTVYAVGVGHAALKIIINKGNRIDVQNMNIKDSMCITVDGVDKKRLVIGAINGVYMSYDEGKTWERVLPEKKKS